MLTNNEIVKALECKAIGIMDCMSCPYFERYPECDRYAVRDALRLINRQQAEIERLNGALIDNEYTNCVAVKGGLIYTHTLEDYDKLIGDISAEAIKEFAQRLKEKTYSYTWSNEREGISKTAVYQFTGDVLDSLVKEMVGDPNDENL